MTVSCNADGTEMVEITDPDELEANCIVAGFKGYRCPLCSRVKSVKEAP